MHEIVLLCSVILNTFGKKSFFSWKLAANYAIDRVGILDASFKQVSLVQNFWSLHNMLCNITDYVTSMI